MLQVDFGTTGGHCGFERQIHSCKLMGHGYSTDCKLDSKLDKYKRLHSMNDPSTVVDFSTVLIEIAPVVNGTKAPRPCAGGVAPVVSGVVSEARE